MNKQIYTLCVFEYISSPKILIFYSPSNHININDFKSIFTNQNFNMKSGIIFSFEFNGYVYNMIADTQKIIYCVITKIDYPKRLVSDCVKELKIQFNSKYSTNPKQDFKELQINSQFMTICKKIYDKYNNPESIDKLVQITNKVNNVKEVMHENISQSMDNIVKLETIELKSEELQQQAGIFKLSTRELKNKMWWKNFKIKLIIFSVIAIILGIIVTIIFVESKAK
jgi:hypothetical protein